MKAPVQRRILLLFLPCHSHSSHYFEVYHSQKNMEVQGSIGLYSWIRLGFILFLSGAVAMKHVEVHTILNQTVLLSVPECKVSDSDNVNWQEGEAPLARWKKDKGATLYSSCTSTCILHQNGSLLLPKIKKHIVPYTLTVYSSDGKLKCNQTLTVIVKEALEQPVVDYDCKKDAAVVRCSTSARSSSNLTLSWKHNSFTTSEKSMTKNIKEQNVEVTCIVKNSFSQSVATRTVSCPGLFLDTFLIVSIAGGAVALIIFIFLVVYSVKYKPWRRNSRSEGAVMINLPHHEVPQPPGLTPGHPNGQGDFPQHGPIQKQLAHPKECPQETGSRKGKKAKSRRPPPQAPGQTTPMYQAAPHQRTPALPGNHPSEQTPRPQPRTMSKAPRQHRKNRP